MEKKINYLARDFKSIKDELISFSQKYYPELSDNFNDASVGSWLIDLMSAVGDDLSYHTDRMYQETNINSANLKSSILNMARLNGVKIPGAKSSVCEVELTIELPVKENEPNWNYAPLIKRGSLVGNSQYVFEICEDVNFSEQFNSNGVSNRKFVPLRDSNGVIDSYRVSKTVLVYSGQSRVFKKVITETELMPFMEVILPEQNIMNVESILFKESSNFNLEPNMFEYYIDEEEFKLNNEDISTYRYFEVNSLTDQYRFGTKTNIWENGGLVQNPYNIEVYNEIDGVNRYYQGEWKGITQKFITEYTDNDYLKIIFGCATDTQEMPNYSLPNKHFASKIINNDMLGLLPKAGWIMYVLYRIGGGESANLGIGSINKIINVNITFPNSTDEVIDANTKSTIINTLKVTNLSPSYGGKDAPSVNEIKYLTKYSVSNQDRCVTLKDYKAKVMSINPRYGCPFRCNVVEDNNKVSMSVLGLNENGKLVDVLPKIIIDNIIEYLSGYKMLTDFVEVRSGQIFHLAFDIDVFIDKNYIVSYVIGNVINKVKTYMDICEHDMGEDIFISDLEREITTIDGVISIIDLRVYSVYGGSYSDKPCPLPEKKSNVLCQEVESDVFTINESNVKTFQIDLNAIDYVLYSDYDSMFEINKPETDIRVKAKLR